MLAPLPFLRSAGRRRTYGTLLVWRRKVFAASASPLWREKPDGMEQQPFEPRTNAIAEGHRVR